MKDPYQQAAEDIYEKLFGPLPEPLLPAFFEDGVGVSTIGGAIEGIYHAETAVRHPEYNNGYLIVVEAYDCAEAGIAGHHRWVVIMTADVLPEALQRSAAINGGPSVFKRQRK